MEFTAMECTNLVWVVQLPPFESGQDKSVREGYGFRRSVCSNTRSQIRDLDWQTHHANAHGSMSDSKNILAFVQEENVMHVKRLVTKTKSTQLRRSEFPSEVHPRTSAFNHPTKIRMSCCRSDYRRGRRLQKARR